MKRRRLLQRLIQGHLQNVAFRDLVTLAQGFGFVLDRISGSHHIFLHPLLAEQVNLQDVDGEAKPYQIRQTPSAGRALQSSSGGLTMSAYHINIFWSDEDGGYIADLPDLEACSAFGRSAEEALTEVEKAREAWLASARAAGKTIPAPRYRPLIYQVAG